MNCTFCEEQFTESISTDWHKEELRHHSDGRADRPLQNLDHQRQIDLQSHEEEGDDQDQGEPDVDANVHLHLVTAYLDLQICAEKNCIIKKCY